MSSATVTLDNCDREPIHVPGSIQPHGCLLACDIGGGTGAAVLGQLCRHARVRRRSERTAA